jgi:L-asparaginase II
MTKPNASLGYAVENLIAPTHTAPKPFQVIGNDDARVTLVTTAAGRVFDILGADGNRIG